MSRLILHLFSTFCPSIWLNDGTDCGQHLCFSCATASLPRCIFEPHFLLFDFVFFDLLLLVFVLSSFFCFCRFAMDFVVALTIKLSNVSYILALAFQFCFCLIFVYVTVPCAQRILCVPGVEYERTH